MCLKNYLIQSKVLKMKRKMAKETLFILLYLMIIFQIRNYSQITPIPDNLKYAFSWSANLTETYTEFISSWQNILNNKPQGIDYKFNRLRIYEDLSDNCPTSNFLPSNDSKMIWEAPSLSTDSIPLNTFRSTSVNDAPQNLDYDLRYIMLTLGSVNDTSKRVICLVNGTHGAHEYSNLQMSKFFVTLLFNHISEPWVQNFFNKYILLIIPCLNVYGNFPNDTYCSYNYGNGNKVLYYDENDQVRVGYANLLANMGDLDDPEFSALWENTKLMIYSPMNFYSRTHPATIMPKLSLGVNHPDVINYFSRLYPNTEPETRALRNLLNKLYSVGYKFRAIFDLHNNGYFRCFTDGWQFGVDPLKDKWILESDSLYSALMKEVWGEDNYPPIENPFNETKLYRVLGTELNSNTILPFEIVLQNADSLVPNDCRPFAEGAVYPNNYVTINGEIFRINNANVNPTDSSLTLVERVGVHTTTHQVGSKILSSILDFPVIKGYTGPFFPEYIGKKYNLSIYRLIEVPVNLIWLTNYSGDNLITPLMYSMYLNQIYSVMHKIHEFDFMPPGISSNPDTIAYTGQLYTYDANASGYPTPKYYLDVNPDGMEIDSINGLITWTPIDSGSFNVTLKVKNGILPDAEQNFIIHVELAVSPQIISTIDTLAMYGQLYSDTVLAAGHPAPKYHLVNYPAGMLIDSVSGIITWTPNALGKFHVLVMAENRWGIDTMEYDIRVIGVAAAITSTPDTIARTGKLYNYDVDASGIPEPKFYLDVFPSGMSIDSVNGIIQWVPSNSGIFEIVVRAENGYEMPAIQSFNILVLNLANCSPDIISYWKMDETFPNVYLDYYSGHNAIAETNPPLPVAGKVSGGQQFDGVDNELIIAAHSDFDFNENDSFSIEFWFKKPMIKSRQDPEIIIGRMDDSSLMRWWVGLDIDGTAIFLLQSKIGELNVVKGNILISDSSWHQIVAVRDGRLNQLLIYVDGNHAGLTSAIYSSGFDSPTARISLGKLNETVGKSFNGVIDEVAIYKSALQPSLILKHFIGGTANKGYCDQYSLLSLNLLLEGLYDSSIGIMKTTSNQLIPTTSPYLMDPRSIDSIPSNVVDWVLVELISESPLSVIFRRSMLLSENGFVVSDDGLSQILVLDSIFNNFYIVVKHRNSIETWSSNKQSFGMDVLNYDFSSDSTQAYGNNLVLKGVKWCIYSGDVNQNGAVDSTDLFLISIDAINYASGYLPSDITGDNFVDLNDLIIVDNNVYKKVVSRTPKSQIILGNKVINGIEENKNFQIFK